jgi:hypothetical protein
MAAAASFSAGSVASLTDAAKRWKLAPTGEENEGDNATRNEQKKRGVAEGHGDSIPPPSVTCSLTRSLALLLLQM